MMLEQLPDYVSRGGRFPVWVDCFMGRTFYDDIAPALRTRSVVDNNDFIIEVMDEDLVVEVLPFNAEGGYM